MNKKSVLITGASTGIGYSCAEMLANKGYHVYAGVRKQKDLERLGKIKNIIPIKLEVTSHEDIANFIALVLEKNTGLYAVINNAGIAIWGPLMEISEEEMRKQFEVNVFAITNLTKALYPLLKESKGRIVNISSVAGEFTYPFMGPYSMSKFALEAYSDALRRELDPIGIKVCIVQPGVVATPIWSKAEDIDKFKETEFGKRIENFRKGFTDNQTTGMDPQDIAVVVYDAISNESPKIRYLITKDNKAHMQKINAPDDYIDKQLRENI